MHLIDILLPRMDNSGTTFPFEDFELVRQELAAKFGGVTAHLRSPAAGLWQDDAGNLCSDEIVIFEVMAEALDRIFWIDYRRQLEARFRQKEIMIRAMAVEKI